MSNEIIEDTFVRLKKEDVGHLKTLYSTIDVHSYADKWIRKSVSIVSPKSGRVLRKKFQITNTMKPPDEMIKEHSPNFFSRLLVDIKKSKVSDFTYQQAKIRQDTSYKPFWVTNVEPIEKSPPLGTRITEAEFAKKVVDEIDRDNVRYDKKITHHNDNKVPSKGNVVAKINITAERKIKSKSSVEMSSMNAIKMPGNYRGSKMFLPNGEQVFWVRIIQ